MLSLLILFVLAGVTDQHALHPPTTAVELRSYGFGMIPFDGKFTRFHGSMQYDPLNPAICRVDLAIEAGSLEMANESIRDRITGPSMMDVGRFPDLSFTGVCKDDTMTGDLTLHGQTHPVILDIARGPDVIVATGHIRRAEWGITGSPIMGGPTIRITVTVPNPFNGVHT